MPIQQPANQIKLTNVSLVRYKKGKKRFELACYKNKLLEYRSGTETDLDNILQVPTIFLNAQKGETAPNAELIKAWPQHAPKTDDDTSSTPQAGGRGSKASKKTKKHAAHNGEDDDDKSWKDAIIEEILKKGEIQVNASERKELLERTEREVIEEVAQRLVDPQTKRVYTTGMIRKGLDLLSKQGGHAPPQDSLQHKLARVNLGESSSNSGKNTPRTPASEVSGNATPLSDSNASTTATTAAKKAEMSMWTGVTTTKSVKMQALDAIRALIAWQPIPVMRARMRLRVTCPTSICKQPARSKADDADDDEGKGTIRDRILAFVEQVESQDVLGEEWEVIGFVEPGAFKGLGEFCSAETKGRGKVEILDMAVVHTDD